MKHGLRLPRVVERVVGLLEHEARCGTLQYYVPVAHGEPAAEVEECSFRPPLLFGLGTVVAVGWVALAFRVFKASDRGKEGQLEGAEEDAAADDGEWASDGPTADKHGTSMAGLLARWVRFWHADFGPYKFGEINKSVYLSLQLALSLYASRVANSPFGDSPLAGPDMVAYSPQEFANWSYPGPFLAVVSPAVLFVWRDALLCVWAATCALIALYPRSIVTKVCLAFVGFTFFYFYGLVQCFVGQNHRFLVTAWSTLGLAISHCTGDNGSWLRKFVLMMMCYTYFAAAVAKQWTSGTSWWQGDVLEWYFTRFVSDAQETHRETLVRGLYFLLDYKWLLPLVSVGAMLYEFLIPVVLLPMCAKLRWAMYIAILGFHTGIYITMGIAYWPQCVCLLLVVDAGPTNRRRTALPPAAGLRVAFTTCCVLCIGACMALRAEAWPFSNIPMYATLHRAHPEKLYFESTSSFMEEARVLAGAPLQFGVGLGRSVTVTVADQQGRTKKLRSLEDYELPSAGVTFKWYGYLAKATALQVAGSASHQYGVGNGPLADLLKHFGPWLAQEFDLCKDTVTLSAELYMSPQALVRDGKQVLASVMLPRQCGTTTTLLTRADRMTLLRAQSSDAEE